jgi:signal transduction histidine kinase
MVLILIADDNSQNLYLLESLLKGNGYEVTSARNGAEALELARQSRPDLIITDIFMPVMDGFALCREWKGDERLKDIPFIFYTATYTDPKDEQFALSLGAERFIVKPQEPDALIEVVRQVLEASAERTAGRPLADDSKTLRQYNEVLFRKLEQKIVELENANANLRKIPSRLLAAMEEERKRIGRDFHDSVVQMLVAIKLRIELAIKLNENGYPETAMTHLEQLIPILQSAIEESRSICMGLRPSILDNLGILSTVEWLCREIMKLYPGIHVEFKRGLDETEIPEELKMSIFRIAQESLNNAAKHSRAERVDLLLARNENCIELTITDAGIGMDLDYTVQDQSSINLGLIGMRERAELTGGRFSIDSVLGDGTTVRVSWPIGG